MKELSSEFTAYKARQRTVEGKFETATEAESTSLLSVGGAESSILDSSLLNEEVEQSEALEGRSEQISKISQEMKQLMELFQQVNQLVLNQDSVLNRIDYNVEQSVL